MTITYVTCDFLYTEQTYREYHRLRERRNMKARRSPILLAALFAVLSAICLYVVLTEFSWTALLCLIAFAACMASAICLLVRPAAKPDREAVREFFRRHGADVDAAAPWTFRERVEITGEGICVSYGPAGCRDADLTVVCEPWSQWRSVTSSDGLIAVLCSDGAEDAEPESKGRPGRSTAGSARHEQARHGLGGCEDAVLPIESLDGKNAATIVSLIERHIG